MKKTVILAFASIVILTPMIFSDSFAQNDKVTEPALKEVSNPQIATAFVISASSITGTMLVFKKLSKKPLMDVVLNSKGWPTLSKFQFLLWTLVIAFSYLAIQIILITGTDYSGEYLLNNVPENLLALMGISVAVPLVNASIPEESKEKKMKGSEKSFGTMFYNPEGNVDLARLQMFLWTAIGIGIFLYIVFSQFWALSEVSELFLPDVSPTLLILMGLSQTAYLGSKIAKNRSDS